MTVKLHVDSIFETSLQKQQIPYERIMSANTPFNIFLWFGIAEDEDTQWVGLYSIFDKDQNIKFQKISKNRELIEDVIEQPPLQRLLW